MQQKLTMCKMRDLDIPMDSNIAVNLQNYQQQSLAERQQLKRLVLQNEARQEHAEVQSMWHPAFEVRYIR